MAILQPSGLVGRVEAVLTNEKHCDARSAPILNRVHASYSGFEGDSYASLTRASCSRTKSQYAVGTSIRNVRQLTIVSAEELKEIGEVMGLPEPINPAWMRANLVISGLPNLTQLPPSSRLIVENGAALVVDMENEPCAFPGKLIEKFHPGFGKHFRKAATDKRGVTAWVEREGEIATGNTIALHIPPQRIYEPGLSA